MAKTPRFKQSDLNPIGMIASAMLTETQFQSLNGTAWVLMDGRNIAGSTYATLTGLTTLPDARGMVLRGKNGGGSALGVRADGSQNPDGDLSLGSPQSHATAKNGLVFSDPGHSHTQNMITTATGGGYGSVNASPAYAWSSYQTTNIPTAGAGTGASLGVGDNETRMRNITVNHFIKINY